MRDDGKVEITVVRSKRKTVAIQIRPDASVVVRAPYRVPQREIDRILEEKRGWIEKQLQTLGEQERQKEKYPPLTGEELAELAEKALAYIPERVAYFAPIVGVNYRRITIRNQKTRWGSCSAKGGLNFNCLLMKAPPEVLDYVVVHELCHRKEMNHSARFWAEVEKVLPDYRASRRWLKEHGRTLGRKGAE